MSQELSPENNPDVVPETHEQAPANPVPPQKKGGWVAVLALLIALLGVVLAGWNAWQWWLQSRSGEVWQSDQRNSLAQVRQAVEAQSQRSAQLQAQIAGLPGAQAWAEQRRLLAAVQSEQQVLAGDLAKISGRDRQSWRLNEAEHLVRLALLRLSALQDVGGAENLLKAADDIVRSQDDPLSFATRGELAKAMEALHSLPRIDPPGLYLKLAALREQVAALQSLAPEFMLDDGSRRVQADAVRYAWWDWRRWRDKLSGYVRLDLQAKPDVRPQLWGQSLAQVRLTLSLALEEAQWGALNGQQSVYRQSIEQALQLLTDYFDAQQILPLQQRLRELLEVPVAVALPDLQPALGQLDRYIQAREHQDAGDEGAKGSLPRPAEQPGDKASAQGDGA